MKLATLVNWIVFNEDSFDFGVECGPSGVDAAAGSAVRIGRIALMVPSFH